MDGIYKIKNRIRVIVFESVKSDLNNMKI